jgi:hypothetical protein
MSCPNLDQGIIHLQGKPDPSLGEPCCCTLTIGIIRLKFCCYTLLRLMAICTGTWVIHATILCNLEKKCVCIICQSSSSQGQSFGLAPFFSLSLSTYNMYHPLWQKGAMEDRDSFPFHSRVELNPNTPAADQAPQQWCLPPDILHLWLTLSASSNCLYVPSGPVTGGHGCLLLAYSWQGIQLPSFTNRARGTSTTGPSWPHGTLLRLFSG